jgi:hypothetical protein
MKFVTDFIPGETIYLIEDTAGLMLGLEAPLDRITKRFKSHRPLPARQMQTG